MMIQVAEKVSLEEVLPLHKLPPLYSQESQCDPVVYIRISSTDNEWNGYIVEGSKEDGEFKVFGLFGGANRTWNQIALPKLEAELSEAGIVVRNIDPFEPAPVSVLVEKARYDSIFKC